MNVQIYVNMVSALIMFIGGLAIVFLYPGQLSSRYRILIALFVTFYFLLRMGQTILAIKRERRRREREFSEVIDTRDDGSQLPKTP